MSLLSLRLGGGPVYGSQVELAATEIVTEVNAYGVVEKYTFHTKHTEIVPRSVSLILFVLLQMRGVSFLSVSST